ncbi:MAG: hypothetical protein AAGA65_11845 [Actinomycetota bacterium]
MTVERPGRSIAVTDAVARAWTAMAEDYGLLPQLDADAVLARFDRGEVTEATPRLLELLVAHDLPVATAADVVIRLGDRVWTAEQLLVIQEVLDAWWREVLMLEPGEHTEPYTPEVVLGILAGFDAPMVRWFEPWISELDGPGATHLASIVVAGPDRLDPDAWAAVPDRAGQLFGWARSETVINGLALVGATHVEDELLSDALDRLI